MSDNENMLTRIDRKLTTICVDIQNIKEDLKEHKEKLEELDEKMDEKFDQQKDICFKRSVDVEANFGKRPTTSLMVTLIVILVGIISGSYGYTKIVDDKTDENRVTITEIKKDCEKNKETNQLLHKMNLKGE